MSLFWNALSGVSDTFRLIRSAAEVHLPLSTQQGGIMLDVVNGTLRHSSPELQAAAVAALSAFAATYAAAPAVQSPDLGPDHGAIADNVSGQEKGPAGRQSKAQPSNSSSVTDAAHLSSIVGQPFVAVVISPGPYIAGLAVSSGGAIRRGSAMGLGALPAHLLWPDAEHAVAALASATQVVPHPRRRASHPCVAIVVNMGILQ
jgi:hypothetical protein